jgi:hypothetical protein
MKLRISEVNQYDNPSNATSSHDKNRSRSLGNKQIKITHSLLGVGTVELFWCYNIWKERNRILKIWGIDTYGSV